jgi:acetylornithine deacetylase
MAGDPVAKASAFVTAEAVRDVLMDMVNISSPTGGEGELANYIVDRMEKVGLDTELQYISEGRPNAVGHMRGRGTGTNLLLTGHMDTSYDGNEPHLPGRGFKARAIEEDGWIWGLGARNMKSGLASGLVALEAIAKAGIRLDGDISYGGVVGEIEKAPIEEFQGTNFAAYGIGSRHLVTHGATADYAILLEPTTLRICTANMGVIWFRISVAGTVNHSAYTARPGVVNAITVMHELYADLLQWAKEYEQQAIFMNERPNVTFSAIRGGAPWRLSRNPYECSLYLEVRTVPGQSFEDIKRSLRGTLCAFAERTGTPEPLLHTYVTDPATVIDENLPVVQALGKAQQEVMGERPPSIMRRTGADAVHFTVYGVPCVTLGPGGRQHPSGKDQPAHVVGEHVLIEDLLTAARIYLKTAIDLCDRPAAKRA